VISLPLFFSKFCWLLTTADVSLYSSFPFLFIFAVLGFELRAYTLSYPFRGVHCTKDNKYRYSECK
jgi:hypothetical protein